MHPRRRPGWLPFLRSPAVRFAVVFGVDAMVTAASLWVAMRLRFEGASVAPYAALFPRYLVTLTVARLVTNYLLQLHRWSFSVPGLQDAVRVVAAAVIGSGLFVVAVVLQGRWPPPRSVIALELLLTAALMLVARFGPRLALVYWHRFRRSRSGPQRTLIVGAGAAGEMLFRDLARSGAHTHDVIGFIDDDETKWSSLISGKRVFGGLTALRETVIAQRIGHVFIAIPRESHEVVRDVVECCAGLRIQIKALPVSFVYFQDRGAADMLRDLAPDDLLSRRRVTFATHERESFAGRRLMVTGAAGSIGSEICRQLLDLGASQIVAVDINENGLYLLEQRTRQDGRGDRFVPQVADIRDRRRIEALVARFRPQDVFHAAAHKHVPLMEASPCEAIKNNITGTRHLLEAVERAGVECLVFISTDKAVAPTSIMGATKRVGEVMTRAVAGRSSLRGCAVRFGNVLGSDGSVVPLFRQQIEHGGPVTITHPDVTRYFMTIPEAVGLVLKAAYGRYGDLCVLNMGEPIRIADLARQMIAMAGLVPETDIPIVVTGLRPGEKLHEELVTTDERVTVEAGGAIRVIEGPPPPADLWTLVDRLERAAADEDAPRTLDALQALVPTYQGPIPSSAPVR